MNRKRKLLLTSVTGLIQHIVVLMTGFILPKLYLVHYGSEANGLVSSIAMFLGFISMAECGVGTVIQSAFYKPLSNHDNAQIGRIYVSSKKFFIFFVLILIVYTLGLVLFYPRFVNSSFDYWYVAGMIIIISINLFLQYFIGMTQTLLLNADQLAFISNTCNILLSIISLLCSVVTMQWGFSIHTVRFISTIVMAVRPIVLTLYVRKNYCINTRTRIDKEPIPQKWNGLTQHIATVVLDKTDVVVLTIFSTLDRVSVYHVYYMVAAGLKNIVTSLTSGYQSMFGYLYAKDEKTTLLAEYMQFEWLIHTGVTLVFSCAAVLITPFVTVYTHGIIDTNYYEPEFGVILCLAFAVFCLRIPYQSMVKAAGHYRQTQIAALIEAILNIVLSIVLVFRFELAGIAIATFVAMLYRTTSFAYYLSRNIIHRKFREFIKHMVTDTVIVVSSLIVCSRLELYEISYFGWIKLAFLVSLIVCMLCCVINIVVYHKEFVKLIRKITAKLRKNGKCNNQANEVS